MSFLGSKIKKLENGREVLEMPDSVNFAILTKDKFLLLARQFRASNRKETLNLFGGYIEKKENWETSLCRELEEESNIKKEFIDKIETIFENKYVSMGYTTEKNTTCIVFLNKSLSELNLKCNDEDEKIEIKSYFLSKFTLKELSKEAEGLKMFLVLKHLGRYTY